MSDDIYFLLIKVLIVLDIVCISALTSFRFTLHIIGHFPNVRKTRKEGTKLCQ